MSYKVKAFIIGITLGAIVGFVVVPAPDVTRADQPVPFDHSQCQYPDRTTNPPDGCDNSDPANPYCAVKGLPEDCQEQTQPAPTTPATTVTPAPAKATECGGK